MFKSQARTAYDKCCVISKPIQQSKLRDQIRQELHRLKFQLRRVCYIMCSLVEELIHFITINSQAFRQLCRTSSWNPTEPQCLKHLAQAAFSWQMVTELRLKIHQETYRFLLDNPINMMVLRKLIERVAVAEIDEVRLTILTSQQRHSSIA